MGFPKGFIWGVAAAAYQIEGAADEDGKGPSVWDVFCKKPNAIWNGQKGDVACDHYHCWKNDVKLMKQLGIQAYRFSISWPRVMPSGTGRVNQKGLDFYSKLIDQLLASNIEPYVTLFHWDYPYELFCRGGWLNNDCSDWFADYARLIVTNFSDRVKHWMTLNEPNGFVWAGHQLGIHAPGLTLGPTELLRIIHNILLSHGKATQVIRALAPKNSTVDFVLSGGGAKIPPSHSKKDVAAAREFMFSVKNAKSSESFNIGESWWLDPVYLGHYPTEGLADFAPYLPKIKPEDLKTISQPLDHFCVNIYKGQRIRLDAHGRSEPAPLPVGAALVSADKTFMWPFTPEALYWGPKFYYERYKKPILITENGMGSVTDWVARDGRVHDAGRVDFLARYLGALKKACADGVDVRAYFQWSILDNFEWSAGYKERYGIVYVDYQTQERIPKDSAFFYKKVIASNGKILGKKFRVHISQESAREQVS
jgi:beta-glucosidase